MLARHRAWRAFEHNVRGLYMHKVFHAQLVVAAVLLVTAPAASADVIDDAYRVCKAMEGTGLTTRCEVKGWGSTIDVRIDTNGAEARKICAGVANQMAKQTRTFAGKWKLQIFSPYSGDQPIAVCTLR